VRFFELGLTHTKGKWAGQAFTLEQWQRDFIRTLFGWKRLDGSRRYRTAFVFVPRKNGKTQISAAIAAYVLLCDGEPEAECYAAASNRDQASLLFNAVASMLRKNEQLAGKVKIRDSTKRIIYKDSFLRAIPANEGGSHGFNSHFVVGDELHAWPNRDFYDVLHTSTGAREQPLEVYITTAGYDQTSICYETYAMAKSIRDGVTVDDAFLPVVYEAEKEDDWQDPATWKKANPNLGVSVSTEYIEREAKKASQNPAYENTFRRLHLNQWTSQDERWLPMHHWDACPATAEPIEARSHVWCGLDLSSTTDFTAFVTVAKTAAGYKSWGHYWLPAERVETLERKHNIPLTKWIRDGWVSVCPGRTIEYGPVLSHILTVDRDYILEEVGYDPYNAHAMRVELEDNHGLRLVEIRQGMLSLSAPSKQLLRHVLEHTLDHSGDPVLRWMADNVMVKIDENGNVRPVKSSKGSGYRHIDGIAALVMALSCADNAGESIYNEEGALFL
jgi:phage terminase large subunit-like protein